MRRIYVKSKWALKQILWTQAMAFVVNPEQIPGERERGGTFDDYKNHVLAFQLFIWQL